MKNKNILLLRTLLLSTSRRNARKYTTDKKKKKRLTGALVGSAALYLLLLGFTVFTVIGYGEFGIIDAAPEMCAMIVSVIALLFTFFKTNGYLFNFREYDMLMSLPFSSKSVAACKFLYMYVINLPWYLSISAGTLIVYGIYARPSVLVYPLWVLLTFFLPILPMLVASFLGFLIARISSGFKKRHIIQTILMFALVLFVFSLRFIMEDFFKNDKIEEVLHVTSDVISDAARAYPPAGWFADAIKDVSIVGMLLLVGMSVLLFALVFIIVGRSYRNINSALKSHAAARNYRMRAQKKHSTVTAVAFKEFKRMTSSSNYMVNGAMGEILAVLFGVVTCIIGFNRIIELVTKNAPFDPAIVHPAIPFIIYFFIGMVATTTFSPSLEGKNFWILQSLPIDMKTVFQGKMLFNLCLSVPFSVFATLCTCISARIGILETILYILLGIVLCVFSTTWGCVCGIKHMRLDWDNELDVIKRGSAVAIYLFPNMFVVMAIAVGSVFLGTRMDHCLITLIWIPIAALLALLCYKRVLSLSKSTFLP